MEKAMIGISQQKKAMIKQRLTSSVSIFLISPYFTTKTVPRAAMPTTTIDQPMISHLKKSDIALRSLLEYWIGGILEYWLNNYYLREIWIFPIIPLFHCSTTPSRFLPHPETILPHQGLKIGTKHTHLLSRPCDVPVMPLKGTEDKGLFDILHRFFPDLFL